VQFIFSDHTLDTERRELHRAGTPIAVEPQVFDLLIYLVENRERVVSKDDLLAAVWGGRIVADSTLASRINAARKAVGDSGEAQKLIRTVARKGVRFVGEVDCRRNGEEPALSVGPRRLEPLPAIRALHEVQFCSHLALSCESPIWRHWTEEFAGDHAFVHDDERGNGLSDWDIPTSSVDAFVRDLEAVVDALGLDRFALIGSSKGGAPIAMNGVPRDVRNSAVVAFNMTS